MRRDVEVCGESGVDGVVIGLLRDDGNIDIERTAKLIEFAQPMSVTFHRAYDMCIDPVKGLEDIIQSGAQRLLTSGQKNKAIEGSELINKLVKQSQRRIIIMPGGGVDDNNISSLAEKTQAIEFHLTGRKTIESEMIFRQHGLSMSGIKDINEFSRKVADTEKIKRIVEILKAI
jgi:copper homeostasis protein